MDKSPDAFRTISEVADWLGTPTHVLRFWESRFTQVKPVKRAGGRRYYRPKDMALLGGIKKLLHDDGMTIRGVQKLLREKGVAHVEQLSRSITDGDAGGLDSKEAPIEINAEPDPVQNVVPIGTSEKGPVLYEASGEPQRGPRGDILRGPTAADLGEPKVSAEKQKQAEPPKEKPAPVAEKPAVAPVQETPTTKPEPEPIAAKSKPEPFVLEPSDELDDDIDAIPGITGVAAALRAAAKNDRRQKPEPEVFTELYDRLKTLRSRMDHSAGQNSAD